MSNGTLAYTSASELAELIKAKKLSPVELVDFLLQRISKVNPKLNAYLTVTEEKARSAARVAEAEVMKGAKLPPLHGVPVSIKDLIFTKGIRTTGGSLVHKDFVPDEDWVAVERLVQAGAIILGKTNTPEFGLSAESYNNFGDDCRNPWNPERTAGGSSGGATTAVAAGLGPLALGTDAGGSIRIPACFCGVFGLKPTQGRIPRDHGFGTPSSPSLPAYGVIGPITRTVRDAALMLGVMAGFDGRDPTSLKEPPPDFLGTLEGEIRGLRLAWSPDLGYASIDPEVRSVVGAAARLFELLGCSVEEATPAGVEESLHILDPVLMVGAYAGLGHLLEERPDDLMHYTRLILRAGREVTGYQYVRALMALDCFRTRMANFFETYDLLLTPTNAVPAFPVRQRPQEINGRRVSVVWGAFPLTAAFNLTGQPAASVPCGFSSDGLPIGLQIIGRWGEETTVLRASAAFEKAQPWADKLPPLT